MNGTYEFAYQAQPVRVVMGPGTPARLPDEVNHAGLKHVHVVCSPRQGELRVAIADLIGDRAAGVYPHARMHVRVESVAAARDRAVELAAIGLGRAIALERELKMRPAA